MSCRFFSNMRRATGFIIYRQMQSAVEYLLLQTSYGIHHWTPPKGHVDPGETDIETAYRETQEEAGLHKGDLYVHEDMKCELKYEYEWEGTVCHKVTLYWLAKVYNNDVKVVLSDEHQDFKWVDLKTACDLVQYADMQGALKQCNQYIEQQSK